ncbi:hypothetical protein QA600_18535 [Natronococcus sp. A-GB1]|uniref:hypothetical protein n=1 Tax=Natronococcus sp. A-GB1 TaxID=3037648 RepID=UPI00241DBE40|nr:hypothetical protein [Natronococcus sp. A-GB1]MDG5761331.1 hypothetical protein [Natronococcus sp. A-GB1]
MSADHDDTDGRAVGGVMRDDIPQILADVLVDHDQHLEVWVRPERAGAGYTIEWTPVEFDRDTQDWQPASRSTRLQETVRDLLERVIGGENREPVKVFAVNDAYLFKHYFEEKSVFEALRSYYNGDQSRFEVPDHAFEDVQTILEEAGFEPVLIRDVRPFCVVYPKYREHPTVLFKRSVLQQSRDRVHIFLMQDQAAVEQAVNQGATPVTDTDLDDNGL